MLIEYSRHILTLEMYKILPNLHFDQEMSHKSFLSKSIYILIMGLVQQYRVTNTQYMHFFGCKNETTCNIINSALIVIKCALNLC